MYCISLQEIGKLIDNIEQHSAQFQPRLPLQYRVYDQGLYQD